MNISRHGDSTSSWAICSNVQWLFQCEKFPNIECKSLLVLLVIISSHPVACLLGRRDCILPPRFVVVESDKVTPETLFLQAEHTQLPQLLLIKLVFHTLPQPHCPPLNSFQHLNVSLCEGPKTKHGIWCTTSQGYVGILSVEKLQGLAFYKTYLKI